MIRNGQSRRVGVSAGRVTSPLISDKPLSVLPTIPTMMHTRELFEKGTEAINQLKYKQEVTGSL